MCVHIRTNLYLGVIIFFAVSKCSKEKKEGIDSSSLGCHLETMERAACSLARNTLMGEMY